MYEVTSTKVVAENCRCIRRQHMDVNQRVDYFRSEIEGKLAKLKESFDERVKSLEAQLTEQKMRVDGALRELRRI